ncbi:MAG: 4,5-DOPA dioxygenase extradiol [Mycobacterium sp.]|nr:MAG: 4,5-DOPA dioxygenase extradiol [Mycobacterium sp.]
MTSSPAAAAVLQALKPSPRMPVLFVGHGSPMNAIEDNAWRRSWQAMGTELLARAAQPQLILCVSAHWLTRGGWQITGMARPKTIHDFGGFPQELFDQQYSAPGAPAVARGLAAELRSPTTGGALGVDESEWGLDHGTWSVLKPMFPKADIPVLQLSMDYSRAPAEHYALGQQLKALRERGVLIVGSGNVVHNLGAIDPSVPDGGFGWAQRFDEAARTLVLDDPADAARLREHGDYRAAVPTPDHFIPLLYFAGIVAAQGGGAGVLTDGCAYGSLSMTSYTLGADAQ